YNFAKRLKVEDHEVIEGTFHVGDSKEKQNPTRTHPAVTTKVFINGKEALFKTGVLPKYPANVSCHVPGNQCFIGVSSQFYLQMENNMKEPALFSFKVPDTSYLYLQQQDYQIELGSGEKTSFPVRYRLGNFGFYSANIVFTVKTKSGEDLSFTKQISAVFK